FVAVGLCVAVLGRELLVALTFTNPAFCPGAQVVPVVTLAYLLHGAFLLTSIGIGISKDTRYYPLITASAVATNLLANLAPAVPDPIRARPPRAGLRGRLAGVRRLAYGPGLAVAGARRPPGVVVGVS